MSRNILLKSAAAACILALLACGLMVFFKGLNIGLNYANAEAYTAGGAELDGPVKNLDINWTDGAVSIAYHAKNTVEISETAAKPITGDAALRWWLDGDTLRIQYARTGFHTLRSLNKALTVTLPEGASLGSVAIDVTSGEVNVPDLLAENVKVDLTSGDLALKQSGSAGRVELSSISGNITADVSEVGALNVSATSGKIRTTVGSAEEVSISSTSGDIALDGGSAGKAGIDSTSGKIGVTLAAFGELKIDATSGDITAALPSQPGYRADVDTAGGRFDYAVPLTRDGNTWICGDGSARVRIDTTSGNVRLEDVNG